MPAPAPSSARLPAWRRTPTRFRPKSSPATNQRAKARRNDGDAQLLSRDARAFVKSAPSKPVHVPTLMIWGEHDSALGRELTEAYEGLFDVFTLRRLPEASHWVQQDAPDAANAALAEWLTARGLVASCG
jgi:pimeloyl-ACP methyl ester carboxylesterase